MSRAHRGRIISGQGLRWGKQKFIEQISNSRVEEEMEEYNLLQGFVYYKETL